MLNYTKMTRVVDKILKNNDVYKNLHKARGRKKDMNMS